MVDIVVIFGLGLIVGALYVIVTLLQRIDAGINAIGDLLGDEFYHRNSKGDEYD